VTERPSPIRTPDVEAALALQPVSPPDFAAVFEAHFDWVWSTLRRLGIPERDCDDAAQNVFVAVFRRLADYDPVRPMKPWLFGFALRTASDYRRTAKNREEPQADPPARSGGLAADAQAMAREDRALVLEALGAVDDDRRAVFVLHEIDEVPIPQVAEALGIPVNTAYSRLRLGREDFRAAVRRIRARTGGA